MCIIIEVYNVHNKCGTVNVVPEPVIELLGASAMSEGI